MGSNMRKLIFLILLIAIVIGGYITYRIVDYRCLSDCTRIGYTYGYCR